MKLCWMTLKLPLNVNGFHWSLEFSCNRQQLWISSFVGNLMGTYGKRPSYFTWREVPSGKSSIALSKHLGSIAGDEHWFEPHSLQIGLDLQGNRSFEPRYMALFDSWIDAATAPCIRYERQSWFTPCPLLGQSNNKVVCSFNQLYVISS